MFDRAIKIDPKFPYDYNNKGYINYYLLDDSLYKLKLYKKSNEILQKGFYL